jgi:preprotein translocase subunit SecE
MGWWDRVRTFLLEVKGELKRTSWPSRTEVSGTTTVVIVTVFIFAFFLYVVDTFLYQIVGWIFKVAG